MSDFAETAVILAVAAVLFFGLGVYFAGGRSRGGERDSGSGNAGARPAPRPAPDPGPEVDRLRAQLAASEARAASLQERLDRALSPPEEGGAGEPAAATSGIEDDPELGAVYPTPPADADDLTVIRGIGKTLARQLNDLGVFKLAQIAAWEKRQVAAFSTRFAFRDRISRDDWVGQAKRLVR